MPATLIFLCKFKCIQFCIRTNYTSQTWAGAEKQRRRRSDCKTLCTLWKVHNNAIRINIGETGAQRNLRQHGHWAQQRSMLVMEARAKKNRRRKKMIRKPICAFVGRKKKPAAATSSREFSDVSLVIIIERWANNASAERGCGRVLGDSMHGLSDERQPQQLLMRGQHNLIIYIKCLIAKVHTYNSRNRSNSL